MKFDFVSLVTTKGERVNPKLFNNNSSVYVRNFQIQQVGSTAKVMFDFTTSTDTRNINFHLQVSIKSFILHL